MSGWVNVVGCDQSLTHTAFQRHVGYPGETPSAGVGGGDRSSIRTSGKAFASMVARQEHIARHARVLLDGFARYAGAEPLLVIEGFSFGSSDSHAHELGGVGVSIRLAAYDLGYRIVEVPPSTLKKYTSGAGNTKKNMMGAAVVSRWGYVPTDDNECDAYALMRIGVDLERHRLGLEIPDARTSDGKRLILKSEQIVEILSRLTVVHRDDPVPDSKAARKMSTRKRGRRAEP